MSWQHHRAWRIDFILILAKYGVSTATLNTNLLLFKLCMARDIRDESDYRFGCFDSLWGRLQFLLWLRSVYVSLYATHASNNTQTSWQAELICRSFTTLCREKTVKNISASRGMLQIFEIVVGALCSCDVMMPVCLNVVLYSQSRLKTHNVAQGRIQYLICRATHVVKDSMQITICTKRSSHSDGWGPKARPCCCMDACLEHEMQFHIMS